MGSVSMYPAGGKSHRCQQCGNKIGPHEDGVYRTVRTLSEKWYCCEGCARDAGHKVTWM